MTTPLTFKNFLTDFIIHPKDARLTPSDQKRALKYSIITGIFLLAVPHALSATYQLARYVFTSKKPVEQKTKISTVAAVVIQPPKTDSIPNIEVIKPPTPLPTPHPATPPASPASSVSSLHSELIESISYNHAIPDLEVALMMLEGVEGSDEIFTLLNTSIDAPHDPRQKGDIPLTFWDLMNDTEFKKLLLMKIPQLSSDQIYTILSEKKNPEDYPSTFFANHTKLTPVLYLMIKSLSAEHLKKLFQLPCSDNNPKDNLLLRTKRNEFLKPHLIKGAQKPFVRHIISSLTNNTSAYTEDPCPLL